MDKIILSILTVLSFNSAWAAKPAPEKCPSISAIQYGQFDISQKEQNGYYAACKTSHYDTDDQWTFIIDHIEASSPDEAYKEAATALNTLSGNPKPTYINGHFGCHYNIALGYYANAYTAQPVICKT